MTDAEREAAIQREGRLMAEAMDKAVQSGNEYFMYRGEADHHRLAMEALIRGRSAEQVQAMEDARGLCA